MDLETFQPSEHFHVPITVAQEIKSKEKRDCCAQWLQRLCRRYQILASHFRDFRTFEQQIDSTREAMIAQIDAEVRRVKEQVEMMRSAYACELRAAIKETMLRSLESWTPESGTLASLIWNSDERHPESLKVFCMWVKKRQLTGGLNVFIESCLPSLSRFNRAAEDSAEEKLRNAQEEVGKCKELNALLKDENERLAQQLWQVAIKPQQMERELSHVTINFELILAAQQRQIADLTTRLGSYSAFQSQWFNLQNEVGYMRNLYSQLEQNLTSFEGEIQRIGKTNTIQTEAGLEGTDGRKIATVCALQQELEKENVEYPKPTTSGFNSTKENDFPSVFRRSNEALKFLLPANEAVRYHVPWLSRDFPRLETVSLGLSLAEILGLNCGRVAEAEYVLKQAIQAAQSIGTTSEEIIRLKCMHAELYYHSGREFLCNRVCDEILRIFSEGKHHFDYAWLALYYHTYSKTIFSSNNLAEVFHEMFSKALGSGFAMLLKLSLCGKMSYAKENYIEAESYFTQAHKLAGLHFSTSIYFGLNSAWLAKTLCKLGKKNEAEGAFFETEKCLSAYFPTVFLRIENLISWAQIAGDMEEVAKKKAMVNEILRAFEEKRTRSGMSEYDLTDILHQISKFYSEIGNNEAAIEKLFEVCKIATSNGSKGSALKSLGNLYCEIGRTDLAIEKYTEAHHYLKLEPDTFQLMQNADRLSDLLSQADKKEEAIELRLEVHRVLLGREDRIYDCWWNVNKLCDLLSQIGRNEEAIQLLLEMHRLLQQRNLMHFFFQRNLELLSNLFCQVGEKQAAIELRLETHRLFQVEFLSTSFFSQNLAALSNLYLDIGENQAAIDLRLATHRVLQANCPTAAIYYDNLKWLEKQYCSLKKPEMAIALRLEASQFLTDVTLMENRNSIGELYLQRNEARSALEHFLAAHELMRAQSRRDGMYLRNIQAIVEVCCLLGDKNLAYETILEEDKYQHEHFSNIDEFPALLLDLSKLYYKINQKEAAINKLLEARELLKGKLSVEKSYSMVLQPLAEQYRESNNKEAEVTVRLDALNLFCREKHFGYEFNRNLELLVNAFCEVKETERAVEVRLEIHRIYIANHISKDQCLSNLTRIIILSRNLQQAGIAENIELQATQLLESFDPRAEETLKSLKSIARVVSLLDSKEAGLKVVFATYQHLLATHPGSECHMKTLHVLTKLQCQMKQLEAAIELRLAAQEVVTATSIFAATNLDKLGELYLFLNKVESAECFFLQAKDLFTVYYPASKKAATNLYNLSRILQNQGKVQEAIETCTLAITIWNESKPEAVKIYAQPLLIKLKEIRPIK